jgi:SAM-dependent methyltransferase
MKTPLLRPVSFSESGDLSPWPARLLGLEAWHKPERSAADVLREYDERYRQLADKWEAYTRQRNTLGVADALHFMRVEERAQCRALVTDEIYRSSADDYLVSSGDQLFAMNLELAVEFARSVFVQYLLNLQCEIGFSRVVETGCGTGQVLYLLAAFLRPECCVGGDICPSAVRFVNRVLHDCGLSGRCQHYDYLVPESLVDLTRGLDDYVLITSHSIEQVQIRESRFVETLATLANPPRRVVHFEPILNAADKSLAAALCRKYAEINRYNQDLLPYLRDCEQRGLLKILDYVPRVFGVSAFNPTSILQWEVRRDVAG